MQTRAHDQRGAAGVESVILIMALALIVFAIISATSDDGNTHDTKGQLLKLTDARFVQTIDGSNAYVILSDEGADTAYCVLHYTGRDATTKIIRSSVHCIDNAGKTVTPHFGAG